MPGCQKDVDEIIAAVGSKELPLADLQACAKRMLILISKSAVYEGAALYDAANSGIEGYVSVERSM